MGRTAPGSVLSEAERAELDSLSRARAEDGSGHGAAGADRARGGSGA